jgi:hypothetical protein
MQCIVLGCVCLCAVGVVGAFFSTGGGWTGCVFRALASPELRRVLHLPLLPCRRVCVLCVVFFFAQVASSQTSGRPSGRNSRDAADGVWLDRSPSLCVFLSSSPARRS